MKTISSIFIISLLYTLILGNSILTTKENLHKTKNSETSNIKPTEKADTILNSSIIFDSEIKPVKSTNSILKRNPISISSTQNKLTDSIVNMNMCGSGTHLEGKKCISNQKYCIEYDSETNNCLKCNLNTFIQKNPDTGDYCNLNSSMLVLWSLFFLILFIGVLGLLSIPFSKKKEVNIENPEHMYYNRPTELEICENKETDIEDLEEKKDSDEMKRVAKLY